MPSPETTIPADRLISVAELQKLSLKKLRELRVDESPLAVRDAKRKRGLFVILDHDKYAQLSAGEPPASGKASPLREVDFGGYGLFWDRPSMTNEQFFEHLSRPDDAEYGWAWARALERLPAHVVTGAVKLADLRRLLRQVKLRPPLQAAWESAIEFWTQESRRRFA